MKIMITYILLCTTLVIAQPDWTIMPSGTTKNINAIWGSSPYNIYAVGEDGLILHYDGFVWNDISTNITADLVDIVGFSSDEIYILSSDTLYERVGNNWGVFAASPSFLYGNTIWGTSGTNLFVGGGMPSGGSSGIYFYNGEEWKTLLSGFSTINDIYGSETGDIYAGGNHEGSGGKVFHYKDCTGNNQWWPTVLISEVVTGVWATGINNAFASSEDGKVFGYIGKLQNGICWQEIWEVVLNLGSVVELQGIWGFPDRIYTFGSKNRLPAGTTTSLIYQFDGQNWTEMTTQTDSTNFRTVYSIWGLDTSNVFAVGENGLILKLYGEVYDTLVVNKTSMEPDLNPGDGLCDIGGPLINGKPPCTLNAAVMESNATPSEDNIIIFDIPGELPQTIALTTQLPVITDRVVIKAPRKIVDDISEPGIKISGSSSFNSNGLELSAEASGTELYNLVLSSFEQHGVKIEGASEVIIQGCYINSNKRNGISISNGSFVKIGGERIDYRNIISGNDHYGISIYGGKSNTLLNNFVGTTPDGISEQPNFMGGIKIENSSENEIGRIFNKTGNLISGNILVNIYIISSFKNKIRGNIIGLNINGDSLQNSANGLTLSRSSDNEIGGFNSDMGLEQNVISKNLTAISIYKGSNNIITGNNIGTDFKGLIKRGNVVGISIYYSSRNVIGSTTAGFFGELNLISGNYMGISIEGNDGSNLNEINNNIIGSNFNKDSLGNDIGIALFGGFDTRIGKSSELDTFFTNYYNNWIYYNKAGLQIFNLTEFNNTEILKNHFFRNKDAIVISGTKNLRIVNNWFNENGRAITGSNSDLYISSNRFDNSRDPSSSIHLNNSYAKVENNLITLDAGDAIKLEDGSTAEINFNNIFDNSGYGVNNTTPSIITNSQFNWWGDANGPSGQGTGNGNSVSPGVDFSNWLNEILAVTVNTSSDTIFAPIGNSDSAFVHFSNWLNPEDILDISLSENFNWLQSPLNYSINLDSAFGISSKVTFQIPGSVIPGTKNLVEVTAVSQSNPSHSQKDTFYIETYLPVVNRIFITPDTVYLSSMDSIRFIAAGYDQYNKILNLIPQWNTTGGNINDEGWFYPGNLTGTFTVTAIDSASQSEGTAVAIVSQTTGTKENLSDIPNEYILYQNYPNPFNPVTTIKYSIPFTSNVTITIYNILGEQVEKLVSEVKNPGTFLVRWDASDSASGVYILMLYAESTDSRNIYRNSGKMILLK